MRLLGDATVKSWLACGILTGLSVLSKAESGSSADRTGARAYQTEPTKAIGALTAPESIEFGLVAHYPFNGNANDESGNGNHGVASNAVLNSDRFGVADSAYDFNGQNAQVLVADNSALRSLSSNYTFNVWARFASIPDQDASILFKSPGGGYQNKWIFWQHAGGEPLGIGALICNAASGTEQQWNYDYPISTDRWHMLTFSSSGTNCSIAIDGVVASVQSGETTLPDTTGAPLSIGGPEPGGNQWFNGSLDDVRIYNRALAPNEVWELYGGGGSTSATISGTIGYGGLQTGTIAVVAGNFTNRIATAGAYDITNLPIPGTYHVSAFLDADGNRQREASEPYGEYAGNPVNLTGDLVGVDIALLDPRPTDEGLVAHYPFNGNANDESGNGNHGVAIGLILTSDRQGNPNAAYYFPGGSSHILCNDPADNSLDLTGDASILAWIAFAEPLPESPSDPGYCSVLAAKDIGGGEHNKWFFGAYNNGLLFHVNSVGYGGAWANSSPFAYETNRFYHVAVVKSGNTYTYYADGQPMGTTTLPVAIMDVAAPLTLGYAEPNYVHRGVIDDVRIYDRALSSDEVGTLAAAPDSVSPALQINPASAYSPADGAEGQTIEVLANVSWTATATETWIEITAGASGTTNGTVSYNVAANGPSGPRTGAIIVAGEEISRTCTVSQASGRVGGGVVINEIYYNPENDVADLEYVELLNRTSEAVDLSGWHFSEGIAFTFPDGTLLQPDAFLVVSRDVDSLQVAYGDQFPAIGNYSGSLDNAGESLVLVNASDAEMDRIRYRDGMHDLGADEWPFEADGSGVSLELWPGGHDNADPANWGIGQPRSPGTTNQPIFGICQSIVINEIQYAPRREELRVKFDAANHGSYMEDGDDESGEYVELFNRSGRAIDVSGWSFTSGISNVIPAGTTIPAGEYLVVAKSPAALTARHGIHNVIGPFDGAVANGGERIALCHALGYLADTVTYQDQHPWPLAPDDRACALECFNPWADNSSFRNWRAATQPLSHDAGAPTNPPVGGFLGNGSPGTRNSVVGNWFDHLATMDREEQQTYVPVSIEALGHSPATPRSSDSVAVSARIAASDDLFDVWLLYSQGANPAASSVQMRDDCQHGDGVAGDGVYGAVLSPMPSKTFVHYRVRVQDHYRGIASFLPFENDPSPTEAFFVYDDEISSGMELFHLFISDGNWNAFKQNAASGTEDLDYVDCSVAIGHVAYPHIGIRPRGRASQNQSPYPMKYRFNKNQLWNGNRTIDTLFQEPFKSEVAARIYRTLGLDELETTLIRVDRNGVYHGTYIGYESPTESWLKKHDLPEETELYKARACETAYLPPYANKNSDLYRNQLATDLDYWGAYNKRMRSLEPPTHIRTYVDALADREGSDLLAWLDANVDLEAWVLRWGATLFMTIDDFTTHNRYEYLPGGGKWSWLGYDYDTMQRGPPLRLFYGDGRGGENRAWQWNRMCDIISGNPTLRRLYLLTVRRMLTEYPADSLFPGIDGLWNQLQPDRSSGHIGGDPAGVKSALLAQQALMLQELQPFNLPGTNAAPQISPPGRTNAGPVQVTLSALAGWDVYVTADGTDPRLSPTRWEYVAPFQIATDAVVQAAALAGGTFPQDGQWTDLARAAYSIEPIPVETTLHFWGFSNSASLLLADYSIGGGTLQVVPGPTTQVLYNDVAQDFETAHLRVNNPLGAQLTFRLPTLGYESIRLEFLTRRSGQGAGLQTFSYTTNGDDWVELPVCAVFDAAPQTQIVDFAAMAGVSDNPAFAVQIAFAQGLGSTAGNNRFDDVKLTGKAMSGSEPPLTLKYFALGVDGDEQDRAVVRWLCVPGWRYDLQWSEDLLAGFYTIATDLLADSTVLSYTNYTHGAPVGYCRVLIRESR